MGKLKRKKELGRKLQVMRERAGLSQDAVARTGRAVGEKWSRSTVAKWENGQRDVTLDEYLTLVVVLGIPIGKSLRELVPDPVVAATPGPGEAEQKAARVLAITPAEIAKLALDRWQATLTEERERRLTRRLRGKETVTPRTRQAMRGRVTRTLIDELREQLKASNEKGRKQ